jgi:UDP-glucose 4-epimerase
MLDTKKILITGGAGYIGSHTIIEIIENASYEVLSVDNFINSSPKTFDRIKTITGKEIKNITVDLRDYSETEKVFSENKNIIGIIHFAALKSVPESVENPQRYYDNNLNSLKNILECAKKFKVRNIIFSSSCSVYGNISSLPVNEETPLSKAESPYAFTKQEGENILENFIKVNPRFKVISLRYFNPVGAHISGKIGEDPRNIPNNLVPVITQTAIGKIPQMQVFGGDYPTRDGTCIRDYIHVSDIANAHVLALKNLIEKQNSENYSVYNLGSGIGVSVFEAIKTFEKISGKKLNYKIANRRDGDVVAIYSDSTKAEKKLGWKPKYFLEDMMSSAWKWQQNQ